MKPDCVVQLHTRLFGLQRFRHVYVIAKSLLDESIACIFDQDYCVSGDDDQLLAAGAGLGLLLSWIINGPTLSPVELLWAAWEPSQ